MREARDLGDIPSEHKERTWKAVYTIVARGEKKYWVRVGTAFTNQDASINVKLDATPTNGELQIREYTPRHEMPQHGGMQ